MRFLYDYSNSSIRAETLEFRLYISAASIIAKVYRDRLMKRLHRKYPKYGLARNKGYGTMVHQEAIRKYGLTRIHRKSFNLQKFL